MFTSHKGWLGNENFNGESIQTTQLAEYSQSRRFFGALIVQSEAMQLRIFAFNRLIANRSLADALRRKERLFRRKEVRRLKDRGEGEGSWADLPETLLADISRRLELTDIRCGSGHFTKAFGNLLLSSRVPSVGLRLWPCPQSGRVVSTSLMSA